MSEELEKQFEVIIAGKDLNDLMGKFKLINPTYYNLYKNTNQRKALERLAIRFGYDKISKAIEIVAESNGMPYAPDITTPIELENKFAKLVNFYKRSQAKFEGTKKIIIK